MNVAMSTSSSTTSTVSVGSRRDVSPPALCTAAVGSFSMGSRVLVIDNYDSFVYNLVQYLGELGATPLVHRHDEVTIEQIVDSDPDAILISPGPGRPEDAGVSNEVIERLAGRVPILGVCLGHQCIGQVFGGEVVRAPVVMHGKTSLVHHDGSGVLAGLPTLSRRPATTRWWSTPRPCPA